MTRSPGVARCIPKDVDHLDHGPGLLGIERHCDGKERSNAAHDRPGHRLELEQPNAPLRRPPDRERLDGLNSSGCFDERSGETFEPSITVGNRLFPVDRGALSRKRPAQSKPQLRAPTRPSTRDRARGSQVVGLQEEAPDVMVTEHEIGPDVVRIAEDDSQGGGILLLDRLRRTEPRGDVAHRLERRNAWAPPLRRRAHDVEKIGLRAK
jgi:hypothetical protein